MASQTDKSIESIESAESVKESNNGQINKEFIKNFEISSFTLNYLVEELKL